MTTDIKKQLLTDHSLVLSNRNKMTATGVEDVVTFNDEKIELRTNMGRLIIKGKNLNVNKLDTASGNFDVTGEVQMLEYVNKRDKDGLLSSLFGVK